MSIRNTAATNDVPTFGNDASFSANTAAATGTYTAQSWWVVTDLSVKQATPMLELADGQGRAVNRTFYNLDGQSTAENRHSFDDELTMTVVAIKDTAANAALKNVPYVGGTTLDVTCTTHPYADGLWDVLTCDQTGSNTAHPTMTITCKWSVRNT